MKPQRTKPNVKIGKVARLSPHNVVPRRGEIWLINLDPTVGSEIKKTRPAVVINSDSLGRLPIRLVAPITEWKLHFEANIWHVQLHPNPINGLTKLSAIDTLQLRDVDIQRFVRKLGILSALSLDEINVAVASIIEYNP